MKKKILYLLIFAVAPVMAAVLFSSCSSSSAHTAETMTAEKNTVRDAFHLKKDKFSTNLQIPGELLAYQQVDLYAKLSGFVKELKVDIGSEVREGELLAVLEAPELFSQFLASESRLHALEATSAASTANYRRLLETSKTPGTVSQNDLDLALARKNADEAGLEAARANVKELGVLKSYLEIRAPFAGIITSRNANPGAYVGPSGKGSEFPLFTLQEQKRLRLAVSVPEAFTGFIRQDDELSFSVRSNPGLEFRAKVKRLSGALDLRLRSERIEMDVDNENKLLLPGTVAEVALRLSAKDSSFTVPKTALVNSNEGVYVVRIVNNKTQKVEVKKGREINDQYEVFGSLSANDVLLVKVNEELKDGIEVSVKF